MVALKPVMKSDEKHVLNRRRRRFSEGSQYRPGSTRDACTQDYSGGYIRHQQQSWKRKGLLDLGLCFFVDCETLRIVFSGLRLERGHIVLDKKGNTDYKQGRLEP